MASVNSDDDASDDDRYISDDEDPVSGEDGADDMSDDEDAASASANASAPRGVAAAHGARPAAAEEKFGKATPWMLPSLFKGRPATIWIPYAPFLGKVREAGLDRVEELTDSRVLPLRFACETQINCVVQTLKRAGFRRLLKGISWNFTWGKCMQEAELRKLQPAQYINHFPGSFTLGRKDYLWRNFQRCQREHPREFDFCAKTYLLPLERGLFERDFREGELYIVKPPAQAEGRGIRMLSRLQQLPPPDAQALVQRYISEPLLINGVKFDMRVYVGVTSYDPLRVYVYEEGLGRFATCPYSNSTSRDNVRNRYAHLTNYSLNKKSSLFVKNEDADADGCGSKWSLTAIWRHLSAQGLDVELIKRQIHEIAVKTLICAEPTIVGRLNAWPNRACPFELYGLDILLDKQAKPWLIEVNTGCSLSSSSPLDKRIKHSLMADLFHLAGMQPLMKRARNAGPGPSPTPRPAGAKSRNLNELRATPLEAMGDAEWDIVMAAEDELARAASGSFVRAFPCAAPRMEALCELLATPRYSNLVLLKWEARRDWRLLAPRVAYPPSDAQMQPVAPLSAAAAAAAACEPGRRAELRAPPHPLSRAPPLQPVALVRQRSASAGARRPSASSRSANASARRQSAQPPPTPPHESLNARRASTGTASIAAAHAALAAGAGRGGAPLAPLAKGLRALTPTAAATAAQAGDARGRGALGRPPAHRGSGLHRASTISLPLGALSFA